MNSRISVLEVRLIASNGDQVGVLDTAKALELAKEEELDLVEIVPNQTPPVCRIMDYGKFRFDNQKKAHAAKKKQKREVERIFTRFSRRSPRPHPNTHAHPRPLPPPLFTPPRQLVVACAITFLVGAVLQLNKLAVLDSAGRQFSQESYASKTSFLVPFAVFKALCNLVVGALAGVAVHAERAEHGDA